MDRGFPGFPGAFPQGWVRERCWALLWSREFPELAWNCWEFRMNVGREEFQDDSRMAAAPPIPRIQSCWKGLGGIRYGNIGVPIPLGLQATSVSPFPDSRTPHCPLWGLQATSLSPSLWDSKPPLAPGGS